MLDPVQARELVQRPSGLTAEQTGAVVDLLMDVRTETAAGAQILASWAQRGETGVELAALVRLLLDRALPFPEAPLCMDVCGTGGSGLTRFNVSTTVAFILAAASVPVAKHGNRGSARPNGSFDLLEALGVPFQFAPAQHLALQRTTGICFLFARQMHPTVAAVSAMRRMAGRRTIFNIAGPLANPCRPRRQIIGVIDAGTAQVVIDAVRLLERERTVVVCGHPGIDEISISGATHVWDIRDGHCRHAIIERICQPGVAEANLPGGDAAVNADLFADLLADRHRGPLLDMVLANAGTALDCWHGRAIESAGAGFAQARELVAQGAAWACYGRHRAAARELAGLHP